MNLLLDKLDVFCKIISLIINKSYDDSVKLQRTEMDPFKLG